MIYARAIGYLAFGQLLVQILPFSRFIQIGITAIFSVILIGIALTLAREIRKERPEVVPEPTQKDIKVATPVQTPTMAGPQEHKAPTAATKPEPTFSVIFQNTQPSTLTSGNESVEPKIKYE